MEQHETLLEKRLRILEEFNADALLAARKRDASAFSDEQRKQMDETIGRAVVALIASDAFTAAVDLRLEYNAGRQAIRFLLYMVGLFIAGFATAWFHFRGGRGVKLLLLF